MSVPSLLDLFLLISLNIFAKILGNRVRPILAVRALAHELTILIRSKYLSEIVT